MADFLKIVDDAIANPFFLLCRGDRSFHRILFRGVAMDPKIQLRTRDTVVMYIFLSFVQHQHLMSDK
jgi:hypothetical protein